MNPNDLLTNVLSRSDHVLWLWCFHAAVTFALVAAVGSSPAIRANRQLVRLLLGGFAFYAYTHLECVRWEVMQWGVVADLLKSHTTAPLGKVADPPHPLWVIPFHLAFDAFGLWALWVAARPRPG